MQCVGEIIFTILETDQNVVDAVPCMAVDYRCLER